MSSIAIITARGGSKRIPRKNIKDFLGKPIIAYSIEAALSAGIFDEVMVSTDDEEIADIARKYGANVPFLRSEETSNDFATTLDVLSEVFKSYEAIGKKFDFFACMYPTAPFVTANKLKEAYKLLTTMEGNSVVPVVKFSFPPQRGFVNREGFIQYQYPEFALKRSQDLEPIYHDAGQFYFCRTQSFLKEGKVISDKTIPLILPEEEVQDIDTISDWIIAEEKYKHLVLGRE